MCGFCNVWVCVGVGFVMCGCFGNTCICIYCVLYCLCCFCIISFIYRVIQEESAILWEMIVCAILSKIVHTNMGQILDGYGVMTA